jgi:drug/metabolite transporter (DMT)-like permease
MLLAVAAVWGSGFVAQRDAMTHMGPMTFNAARYALGGVVLAPLVLLALRRGERPFTRGTLAGGLLLGAVMAVAAGLQQVGLVTTTASRAGFITGLYVLFVPLFGLALRQRPTPGHVLGGAVAVLGLWMLSGDLSGGIRTGDLLILGCAVAWALHVTLVGLLAPRSDALALATLQFAVVAALTMLAMMTGLPGTSPEFRSPDLLGGIGAGWAPIAYSGVAVIALAFTLQIFAQRHAPATHAAVLMSLEAVFGAVFGVMLLHERLTRGEILGCGLMFAGMLISQLWPHRPTPGERAAAVDPIR